MKTSTSFILLLASLTIAAAKPPSPPKFLGHDRWEGVETQHPVSGELLSIISLKRESSWKLQDLKDKITLRYQIPADGNYEVKVHSPDDRYQMQQSDNFDDRSVKRSSGDYVFPWDAEFIKELRIEPEKLFCLISKKGEAGHLVPSVLVPAAPNNAVISKNYTVTVLSNTDIRAIKLTVLNADGIQVPPITEFKHWLRGRPLPFVVSAVNLKPGAYKLSFDVTFDPSGQTHKVERSFNHAASP